MSKLSRLFGGSDSKTNLGHEHKPKSARRSPADLLRRAGYADEPAFEQLEERKLMFNLVVNPADPTFVDLGGGIGQVTADFGYAAPFLQREIPGAVQLVGDTVTYDQVPIGNINSPTVLRAQPTDPFGLRISHTGFTPGQVRVASIGVAPADTPRALAVDITTTTRQITFEALNGNTPRVMQQFIFRTTGTGGFNAGSQIELVRNNVVVQTLTFAQINATAITDPTTGVITYTIGQPGGVLFDQLRISRSAAGTTQLRFIETDPLYPPGRFGEYFDGLVFGARLVLTGRIGTTATVLDLYGRDMQQTIALGTTADNPDGTALIDADDNGVPDFNDGIGRIVLSNTDSATQVLLTGGTIQAITTIEEFLGADAVEQVGQNFFGFYFPGNPVAGGGGGGGGQVTPMSGLAGFYDDAGFGFAFDNTGDIVGLGNTIGSVIVGSPFIRNNSGADPVAAGINYHGVDVSDLTITDATPSTLPQVRPQQIPSTPNPGNFGLADVQPGNPASLAFSSMLIENALPGIPTPFLRQGIFATGAVGDMYINGMLFGSSQFDDVIGNLAVGTLYGSLRVEGDASSLYVGSDSGTFIAFRNGQLVPVATGNQVVFGRAVGNITIGATNRTTFQILGDTLNPARPVGDFLNYNERENVLPVNPQAQDQEYTLQSSLSASGPILFDGQTYRNDGINGAEFVGSGLRGAIITGVLGLLNGQPHEDTAGEDAADVFAFAAGVGQAVTISVSWTGGQNGDRNYARVVDSTGRVLAAPQFPFLDPNSQVNGGDFNSARFTFTPSATGVYYVVFGSQINGQNEQGQQVVTYTATLTGQLPVALGSFTAAGGNRADFLRVANGDVGLLRYGTGIQQPDGTVRITPETSIDAAGDPLEQADVAGSSINVSGSLYEIIFGGTIINPQGAVGLTMAVGGNLGRFTTGFNIGADGEQGDLQAADITVGGSIGLLDISGSIGYQTTATDNRTTGPKAPGVTIRTGGSGVPGNIGQIRVGNLVNGQIFTLVTSANSVIERFDLGTRSTGANSGQFVVSQPTLQLGAGSDIRFTNFTQTPYQVPGQATNPDLFIPLNFNTPITLTDDNGAQVRILITGPAGAGGVPLPAGTLRILPFNGPNSGPIGAIELDAFAANSIITITGLTANTSVDIGNIIFNAGATGGATAAVRIVGPGTVNVRNITATGTAFNEITNLSPNGDLISVIAGSVNRVQVVGDLGFTNYITSERSDTTTLNSGQTTVPLRWIASDDATDEDLGAPDLTNLNGIFIIGGTTALVSVNGRLGDVISGGVLTQVTANADAFTPSGQYNGVEGVIFATNIRTIDIGDGLRGWGESPFATAGIFATGHIGQVLGGTRVRNPVVNGAIIAQGAGPAIPGFQQGIGTINLTSGIIDGAYIGGAEFQSAWASVRFSGVRQFLSADPPVATTNINNIVLSNATMSRSTLFARAVRYIAITGGAWDANNLEARAVAGQAPIDGLASGTIGTIAADRFTNTTLDGEPLEARYNQIRAGGSVTAIRTNNPTVGDFSDIFIDVVNNVGTLSGRNFNRVRTNIGTNLTTLSAFGDIRGSVIGAGRLSTATAANIRQSSFNISGPITTISVSNLIADSIITSDGPNGAITTILATNGINANISSSGIISTINSARGDITGSINTTDASDGSVTTIYSGRDMTANLNIVRNLGTVTAVGNIGRRLVDGSTPDFITVAGTLGSLNAAAGTIYSDVTVGGAITGAINAGRAAFALPTNDWVSDARIVAGGRIASITWTGDFAGQFRSNSGGIGSIRVVNGSIRNLGRDGNGAPINSVQVGDGDLTSLVIVRGHLLGSVAVPNGSLSSLSVTGDAVFGNIGISPALSVNSAVGVPASEGRNQLPPGAVVTAAQDGPTILVGRDLTSLNVTGGIFESGIIVGRNLGTVIVGRGTDNVVGFPPAANTASFIVAADAITTVSITQGAVGLFVGAGVLTLGDDFRPGGTGTAADTNKSGTIGTFRAATTTDVVIEAGIIADGAGSYTGPTATVTDGLSTITSVTVPGTNTANNTVVRADVQPTAASIRLNGVGNVVDGGQLLASDPRVATTNPGVQILAPNSIITVGAVQARVTLTGPGTIFYDQATRQITLRNTTVGSSLRFDPLVIGTPVNLSGLVVRTWDDASLAAITASANVTLSGATDIYVDGNVTTANFQALTNVTGTIEAGGNMTTILVGVPALALNQTNSARFVAQNVTTASFTGNFGNGANSGLVARNVTTFTTTGAFGGRLSSDFDITTFRAGTDLNGGVRAGYNINTVTAVTMTSARVSAGGNIASVTTTGTVAASTGVSGTFIGAGSDLGRDAAFGGTGLNADSVSNGNLGPVTIGGNFVSSDIAAGVLRGATAPSIGLSTDRVADGRSSIGNVIIRGTQVGTLSGSQQFRIISNGTLGTVTVGTQTNFTFAGNFRVQSYGFQPVPIVVTDLRLTQAGGIYQARMTFNQAIDASTLAAALSIAEIRPPEPIVTQFPLVSGTDYVVNYDPNTLIATITFSQTVTSRPLVPTVPPAATLPNAAAPGVYRFILDASILRGQAQNARLDGNADAAPNDNYSNDIVVGDAGDRFSPFVTGPGNAPNSINFYTPVDLNLLMDSTQANNSPSINRPYTLSGIMGDHPNSTSADFSASSDVDLFTITLQAGQIIRIGALGGTASAIVPTIVSADPAFAPQIPLGGDVGGNLLALPSSTPTAGQTGAEQAFLVRVSGTYGILLCADPATFQGAGSIPGETVLNSPDVVNLPPIAGAVGDYSFTVTVFDDGNTGFAGTPSNNGQNIPVAPLPSAFQGPTPFGSGRARLATDLPFITSDGFTWVLEAGANNLLNGNGTVTVRSDDIVRGTNGAGAMIERRAGADGIFSNAAGSDDVYSVVGNIGDPGAMGGGTFIQSDVDIYNLNNGTTVTAGSRYRVTMRVTDGGWNLGRLPADEVIYAGIRGSVITDRRGQVQLGIFDTSAATTITNGRLIAAPQASVAIGGTPNTVLADSGDGLTRYGYDSRGDFYIEFTAPPRQDNTAQDANIALYVQGVNRSRYQLDVQALSAAVPPVPAQTATQNFYIETNGAVINWLETGGRPTVLEAYNGSVNGFQGFVGGVPVDQYIITNLLQSLRDIFAAIPGFVANTADADGSFGTIGNIRISTNVSDFDGQEYSSIFLAGNVGPPAFFNNGTFGAVQRVDAFNANHRDQAVVFAPAFNALGNPSNQAGIDNFVNQLSAAMARRMGELMGVRITANTGAGANTDLMAANSPTLTLNSPAQQFRFVNGARALSPRGDSIASTDFFLGNEADQTLLQRIFAVP